MRRTQIVDPTDIGRLSEIVGVTGDFQAYNTQVIQYTPKSQGCAVGVIGLPGETNTFEISNEGIKPKTNPFKVGEPVVGVYQKGELISVVHRALLQR
jgi:hypothetical protein